MHWVEAGAILWGKEAVGGRVNVSHTVTGPSPQEGVRRVSTPRAPLVAALQTKQDMLSFQKSNTMGA